MPGTCSKAAEHATRFFLKKGIKDFEIVEGIVALRPKDRRTNWEPHTWIEFKNGRIYDPTKRQWLQFGIKDIGQVKVKKIISRYTPEDFLGLCDWNNFFNKSKQNPINENTRGVTKWWIDSRGNFYDVSKLGHSIWGAKFITKIYGKGHDRSIEANKNPNYPYKLLYEMGWVRALSFTTEQGITYFAFTYGDRKPSSTIISAMKNKAKELGADRITDETGGQTFLVKEGLSSDQEKAKEKQVKDVIGHLTDDTIILSIAKYDEIPGASYVQVDGNVSGHNVFSSNPEDMIKWGYPMPTTQQFLTLPMGRYTLTQAKKLLQKQLNENMSYDDLIKLTANTPRSPDDDTNRIDRSKNVRSRSIPVSIDEEGHEQWNFRYKSTPQTTVTNEPFEGRITFLKGEITPQDDANKLDCEVDCSCPDYMYRFASNNARKGAGAIGPDSLNQAIDRKPKPAYDIGEGLCKHLCSLSKHLQTQITNTGKSNLFEAVQDVASQGPFSIEYYDD